jgi:hypothetical protein
MGRYGNSGLCPDYPLIINVIGEGPGVRIARDAAVAAPILAPKRKLVANANTYSTNLFAGNLVVRGATITETRFCP